MLHILELDATEKNVVFTHISHLASTATMITETVDVTEKSKEFQNYVMPRYFKMK